MHRLINVIPKSTSTARFSTSPKTRANLNIFHLKNQGNASNDGYRLFRHCSEFLLSAVIKLYFSIADENTLSWLNSVLPRVYQACRWVLDVRGYPNCYAYSIRLFRKEGHFTKQHPKIYVCIFVNYCELHCHNKSKPVLIFIRLPSIHFTLNCCICILVDSATMSEDRFSHCFGTSLALHGRFLVYAERFAHLILALNFSAQ